MRIIETILLCAALTAPTLTAQESGTTTEEQEAKLFLQKHPKLRTEVKDLADANKDGKLKDVLPRFIGALDCGEKPVFGCRTALEYHIRLQYEWPLKRRVTARI